MRLNVHVVAPTVRDKMEHLGELQWVRTVVDLEDGAMDNKKGPGLMICSVLLTTSTPVTFTMSDATVGEEGCASRVVTLCCTFWKGNDCTANDVRVRSIREGMECSLPASR